MPDISGQPARASTIHTAPGIITPAGVHGPQAPRADIESAARDAGLGVLIAIRPEGFDMLIDHRGSGLSGGERRRIGIARVLLKDVPLWLLDEPAADLDAASATDIAAILCRAGRGRTVIIATHNAELAAAADVWMTLP